MVLRLGIDVMGGISTALEEVIEKAGVARDSINVAMIGTTHFTNAIIERRHLDPVAAIRLGLPATACLPPMVDWPCSWSERMAGYRSRGSSVARSMGR